jgi:creatinine amidohydrolase
MGDVIDILQLPHGEAKKLARSGAPIYLPINPVEYHGPHLPLRNDGLVSSGLIRQLGDRLQKKHDWPILALPDLEIGVEPSPGVGSRWTHLPTARPHSRSVSRARRARRDEGGARQLSRRAAACARARVGRFAFA